MGGGETGETCAEDGDGLRRAHRDNAECMEEVAVKGEKEEESLG